MALNKSTRVMHHVVVIGSMWLLALAPIDAHSASKVEKDLIALQQAWADARVRGDAAFLDRLYAEGFWMTAMDGTVVQREAAITMSSTQETKPEAITYEDVKIVVDGLTAIVSGRENVKTSAQGVSGGQASRFTTVFVRRQKTWKVLTHQLTRIAER